MKLIPLTQGEFAQVDDEDFEWLGQWKWYCHQGYAQRSVYDPISKKAHSVHMTREITKAPDGLMVDHRDLNTLNNQRSNLRICTRAQNGFNSPAKSNNTSGFKGVNWTQDLKKWQARIRANGKRIWLGYFETAEDAASAYEKAAKELHGEFAHSQIGGR